MTSFPVFLIEPIEAVCLRLLEVLITWSLLHNLRVSLNQKVFDFKNYFEKVSVQVLLILSKMLLRWLPYSGLLWDWFKNLPTVVRTLQLPILGITAILVASRRDFRVHFHFPLEFEDLAMFRTFNPLKDTVSVPQHLHWNINEFSLVKR